MAMATSATMSVPFVGPVRVRSPDFHRTLADQPSPQLESRNASNPIQRARSEGTFERRRSTHTGRGSTESTAPEAGWPIIARISSC